MCVHERHIHLTSFLSFERQHIILSRHSGEIDGIPIAQLQRLQEAGSGMSTAVFLIMEQNVCRASLQRV